MNPLSLLTLTAQAGVTLTGETADVRIYDAAQAAAWVARTFKRGLGSYDGT